MSGIYSEPLKVGTVMLSQSWMLSEYNRTGIVSSKQTQNRLRNMAIECPACLSCFCCSSSLWWLWSSVDMFVFHWAICFVITFFFFSQSAVFYSNDPFSYIVKSNIMADDDHGPTFGTSGITKQLHHLVTRPAIQISRWL